MKKSKLLFWILGILLILAAAFAVFWFVKAQVASSYLTDKMKVPVSILDIRIRPTYSKIFRFHISNPRGSPSRTAFSSKTITVNYQWKGLFSNPTVIDLIQVDDAFLAIDFYNPMGTSNNWTAIIAGMKQDENQKEMREVLIRKLVVNNLSVQIRGMGISGAVFGKVERKFIPRLEFDNINSKEGFPTKELIQAIFGSTGILNYIKDAFSPQNLLQKGLPFRLFGELDREEAIPSE
jgi:hypothetical protein